MQHRPAVAADDGAAAAVPGGQAPTQPPAEDSVRTSADVLAVCVTSNWLFPKGQALHEPGAAQYHVVPYANALRSPLLYCGELPTVDALNRTACATMYVMGDADELKLGETNALDKAELAKVAALACTKFCV